MPSNRAEDQSPPPITSLDAIRRFVENRRYASDLLRRTAWERCASARTTHETRLPLRVRAAGRAPHRQE
jgi:hypothetical protein